jgi:transcriptional regulator with XRE-family HTH domain
VNPTNGRIQQLMDERDWTEYRLAKESKLSQSTIANLFKRNTTPSVTTLEAICGGFGITLAQFFSEGNIVELSDEQKELFDRWVSLTAEQKQLLFELIRQLK